LYSFLKIEDPHFYFAAKQAVDKAGACGVEINFECCNYAIMLNKSNIAQETKMENFSEVLFTLFFNASI
jgi:hypothetical protein